MQDDKICYDVCTSQNVDDVAKLALKLWNDADYDELKDEAMKTGQSQRVADNLQVTAK